MKLLHLNLASLAAVMYSMTAAADTIMEFVCEDCRSTDHSRDFGNFALNQTYGPGSSVLEDELIIFNSEGGWVHVDLSFVLEENIISNIADFIGLDLGIPTGKIQIDTTTDTTQTDSYRIDLDIIDTMGPLPVGDDNYWDYFPGTGTGSGGDSSGGGSTSGGGVGAGGAGTGSTGGTGSGGGGNACTSAGGGEWHCVPY